MFKVIQIKYIFYKYKQDVANTFKTNFFFSNIISMMTYPSPLSLILTNLFMSFIMYLQQLVSIYYNNILALKYTCKIDLEKSCKSPYQCVPRLLVSILEFFKFPNILTIVNTNIFYLRIFRSMTFLQ